MDDLGNVSKGMMCVKFVILYIIQEGMIYMYMKFSSSCMCGCRHLDLFKLTFMSFPWILMWDYLE